MHTQPCQNTSGNVGLCHGSYSYLLVCHPEGPGLIRGWSMWDMWWTNLVGWVSMSMLVFPSYSHSRTVACSYAG